MGKLCKDQLIGKLVAVFRDAETDIDEAVKEAKNQLAQETKKAKCEDLKKLFDDQIQTLKDRGCPEQIVEMLQNQRSLVLQKASEMSFAEGNIPFMPVIPRTYRSPHDLMAMVRNGDTKGYTYLNPTVITDEFKTPEDPYYIYDVEDGQALLGKSPEEAIDIIKKQSRSPLTAAEVMALTTHTDVISRHYVYASGSRYDGWGRVPDVCLDDGDQPGLYCYFLDDSDDHWGSASCGSR
jgi:hypothetical protein